MKEETNTISITYRENMTMKELVNEINRGNQALMLGIKATIANQTDLLLKKFETDINGLETKLGGRLDTLESDMKEIKEFIKDLRDKK